MKWCRYQNGDTASYGIIEGENVIEISGDPFGGYSRQSTSRPLNGVKLLPPVIPSTFYAAGINYREHIIEMAEKRGEEPQFPPNADVGYRANNALTGQNDPIIVPKDATELLQYEGELVVVFGKKCKNVSESEAFDYVFGYTIGNDVSERTWQADDRTLWRAKNADTFKPMGPWIDTDVDINVMDTIVRVNGEEVQNFKTNNMIFDIPTYISRMSQYMTLHPGDVIWMGTDGVGTNIKSGDVVEVELTGIGVLRNPVVAAG